jgi:type IV pilus assembly protein PilF
MHNLRSVALRLCLAGAAAALLLSACSTGNKKTSNAQNAAIANTQLGSAYMNQGNLALAKDKLDRALAQDPSNPEVHSVRGMLFDKMGMPKDADAEFRTALRLAPKDPNVINNYAVFLCQRGRTDEGVKLFEQAATNALYSTPEAAYTNAGVCLRSAKRDDQARAEFVKALQMLPMSVVTTYGYVNPVIAVILGAMFISEPITRWTVAGSALTLLGVAGVFHEQQHRKRQTKAAAKARAIT